ncbi:modifier of suppressor tRNAs [Serratia phage 4S]|nr:modifier of suppressor tRNAs [Serratia phage 4S]
MKTVATTSTREAFEDVLYNPELVVVQKDWSDHLSHTQVAYVFANVNDKEPIYAMFREVTEHGTDYWKEVYSEE